MIGTWNETERMILGEEAFSRIPEKAWTHKSCPRCSGMGMIRVRVGNVDHWEKCHYYGATYKVTERARANMALEGERF